MMVVDIEYRISRMECDRPTDSEWTVAPSSNQDWVMGGAVCGRECSSVFARDWLDDGSRVPIRR